MFKERMNLELEAISFNKLTELGNRAARLGLISGHGYRKGQYELLQQGQFILLDPKEATLYLENLLKEAGEQV